MASIIRSQNKDILTAWWKYNDQPVIDNNLRLAAALGIDAPPAEYTQEYAVNDIRVKVI
jgi:hypothetical protein